MMNNLILLNLPWIVCLILMLADLKGAVSNEIGYVGLREDWDDRLVARVYKNSPAEKAGIKVGDKIIEVDGKKNGSLPGEPYTTVKIKLRRAQLSPVQVFFNGKKMKMKPTFVDYEVMVERLPKSKITWKIRYPWQEENE